MTTLIDSHCHLNYDYSPKTVDDVVREAREAGVETLVTIGTEMKSLDALEALSARFDCVYHTVGVHPHDAAEIRDEDLPELERRARHPRCVAIGEIGLDYHYDHSPREIQQARLREQLAVAARVGKPVVIHSREAEPDLLVALTEYARALPAGRIPGIIHCFSGSIGFGESCLALGFYISFSGILTFKKADDLREAARLYPLDRILVETDSPYLAPIPFRGKKCEPAMVRFTAQKLGEIKGVSIEEIAAATTANSRRVFGI
jgi:TatD DNase family protein